MSKNKPKTIADLKINWIFNRITRGDSSLKIIDDFNTKNPSLVNYKIKKGEYSFLFKGAEFSHYCYG